MKILPVRTAIDAAGRVIEVQCGINVADDVKDDPRELPPLTAGLVGSSPPHGFAIWDGTKWTGDPPPAPRTKDEALAEALIKKGVVTREDIDAEKLAVAAARA